MNTKIVVFKVNENIKDQIKLHNEFNTNTKGKIVRD